MTLPFFTPMPIHPCFVTSKPRRYILPIAGIHRLERAPSEALNSEDPPVKQLQLGCAMKIAEYMLRDPRVERGMIIDQDFNLIPFNNRAAPDARPALIEMLDDRDFNVFADLAAKGRLWGWAHSHPSFDCTPSGIDLHHHQFNCNMVIFSCLLLCFAIYSAEDLTELEKTRNENAQGATP